MERKHPQENTVRVLILAAAFFGSLAALGIADHVFERLGPATRVALAAFAAGFAALTYWLDPQVRALVDRALGRAGARTAPAKSPGAKPAAT